MAFVKLLEQNRGLFSKCNSTVNRYEKEKAAKNISDMWRRLYGEEMAPKKVIKKFHNMKNSIKQKLRRNGQNYSCLEDWERILNNLSTQFADAEKTN